MKKKLVLSSIIILALIINVGWQKKDTEDKIGTEGIQEDQLLGFESNTIDFSKVECKSSETKKNEKLEKTIIDYLNYNNDEDGELKYYYNTIDLNGDKKEEFFVYLTGASVSGSGGSTALIINQEDYNIISNFTLVQAPIIISNEKTNGWNDIIMQVSGGGSLKSYTKIQFNGESYPSNPSTSAVLEEDSSIEGISIFSNSTNVEDGLELK